ncbi:hypothetical protein B4135_3842 [Caldibacillus debilis]|uniref:Uncharacterized protein n=1 Tax=Caldibacillus debilis TaxID=301148 RepID=A0A150L9C7_9BACI|nr:hypothetical protein B4135_3842 [Caldibacillus debilis]
MPFQSLHVSGMTVSLRDERTGRRKKNPGTPGADLFPLFPET